jgi:type I restriction enzyme S subunit
MEKYQSYKPSGVEWIGDIPEHWKKCRLKNVSKSVNGYSFKSDDFDREFDIPVIRIGDVGDKIDFEDCIKVKSDFLTDKKDFIVFRNDILIGLTGGTIGKSGRYNYDTPSLLNQRVGLLRNNKDLLNGLLYHYVKSEVLDIYFSIVTEEDRIISV